MNWFKILVRLLCRRRRCCNHWVSYAETNNENMRHFARRLDDIENWMGRIEFEDTMQLIRDVHYKLKDDSCSQ